MDLNSPIGLATTPGNSVSMATQWYFWTTCLLPLCKGVTRAHKHYHLNLDQPQFKHIIEGITLLWLFHALNKNVWLFYFRNRKVGGKWQLTLPLTTSKYRLEITVWWYTKLIMLLHILLWLAFITPTWRDWAVLL